MRRAPALSRLGRIARGAPALAAMGYASALTLVTWPLLPRLGSATYGGPGDGWALIWQSWRRERNGVSYFSPAVDRDIAWPFGADVTTGALISNAATELPTVLLIRLGAGPVLAHNVVLLAVALTSALAMYVLVRYLGCHPAVAFWAGLVYMMTPWYLDRLAIHLTLSLVAAFPLLLLGLVQWMRGPSVRASALVVAATALAAYSHAYWAAAAAVLAACLPVALVRGVRVAGARTTLLLLGAAGGALATAVVPIAVALARQSDRISAQLERALYLDDLALQPHLLVLPSVENPVFGSLVRGVLADDVFSTNTGELALYIGWSVILLAAVAAALALRRGIARLPVAVAAIVALTGLALALPATLDVPVLGPTSMPVAYLQDVVAFISTPARFVILLLTAAIVVAAIGLDSLAARLGTTAAVGTAIALALIELPVWVEGRVVTTAPTPLVEAIERAVPAGEPLMQYPSVDRGLRPTANQLFWQTVHRRPLVNGAPSGSPEDRVRDALADPGREETPAELALLGVGWATYEPADLAFVPLPEYRELQRVPAGFEVVERLPDESLILKVVAAAAPGIAARAQGFEPDGTESSWRWIGGSRAELLVCSATPGVRRLNFRARAFDQPRTLAVGGKRVTVPADGRGVRASVPLRMSGGWQRIPLRVVGSRPTRPSEVIPGSSDERPLAVELDPPTVSGPAPGPGTACRTAPSSTQT